MGAGWALLEFLLTDVSRISAAWNTNKSLATHQADFLTNHDSVVKGTCNLAGIVVTIVLKSLSNVNCLNSGRFLEIFSINNKLMSTVTWQNK